MGNEKLTRFLQSTGLVNASQAEGIASDFIYKEFAKNSFLLQAGRPALGETPDGYANVGSKTVVR